MALFPVPPGTGFFVVAVDAHLMDYAVAVEVASESSEGLANGLAVGQEDSNSHERRLGYGWRGAVFSCRRSQP
jgi:hypothetical protein